MCLRPSDPPYLYEIHKIKNPIHGLGAYAIEHQRGQLNGELV